MKLGTLENASTSISFAQTKKNSLSLTSRGELENYRNIMRNGGLEPWK